MDDSSFHWSLAVSIMFATAANIAQRCAVEANIMYQIGAIGRSGVLLQQKHPSSDQYVLLWRSPNLPLH